MEFWGLQAIPTSSQTFEPIPKSQLSLNYVISIGSRYAPDSGWNSQNWKSTESIKNRMEFKELDKTPNSLNKSRVINYIDLFITDRP
jgi:hypothetical protein